MNGLKQLALIGPTASGKTALAVKLAQKIDAYILSLDSLAIYKEIDIVSAKPTEEERGGIRHFGIDVLYPNEPFDVTTFAALYQEVLQQCHTDAKHLVIVGGTSFYLKMLLEGISDIPSINAITKKKITHMMIHPDKTYDMLCRYDPTYMTQIKRGDTYRIQKALEIYLATKKIPSIYFREHPPHPIITDPLPIYEIIWERELLRERIGLRTEVMLNSGLIDEIVMLEKKYTRAPNAMKAIGIKETLAYLDGAYDKKMLKEKITTNTARLAKRQATFNRSQFKEVVRADLKTLEKMLLQ
ncbi:tRNA dimethylallyltransferase [hydrothermal vent metagenome]|uniref:tRNA dimethylallyltransferase n=1 Tax=hydrothermal vent metagenome TaxID=652676 RepID=A0A1W1EAM7_9ZZZZ